ncbi:hypothetical protein pb186bvf_004035 [Paramecium bursaria]
MFFLSDQFSLHNQIMIWYLKQYIFITCFKQEKKQSHTRNQ